MATTYNAFSHPLYVMLKPAGSLCNLRCKYCYYIEKGKLYKHDSNLSSTVWPAYYTCISNCDDWVSEKDGKIVSKDILHMNKTESKYFLSLDGTTSSADRTSWQHSGP